MEILKNWMLWSHAWAVHGDRPGFLVFWGLTHAKLELLMARHIIEMKASR
jgi:hypothetical protein